jgi:uncharacterized membrane protein (UPF0127 family)
MSSPHVVPSHFAANNSETAKPGCREENREVNPATLSLRAFLRVIAPSRFLQFQLTLALSFLLLVHIGCDSAPARPSLPTTNMRLGFNSFIVEIANSDPDREHGLMQRDSMPGNHGMIFVFADEKPRAFWMKNTRFPLDIVYLDHNGKIVSIKQMQAYDLTSVPSDQACKYAIELNAGVASASGLKVGDTIAIPAEAKDAKN